MRKRSITLDWLEVSNALWLRNCTSLSVCTVNLLRALTVITICIVVFDKLLPEGTIVRRNFSFAAGEKGFANRMYRRIIDSRIKSRHILTDYFFSLAPLEPLGRLERICALAAENIVEVETHPVNAEEYTFLTEDGFRTFSKRIRIARRFMARTPNAFRRHLSQ